MNRKFKYVLIGYNYYDDIQNDLFKFDDFLEIKSLIENSENSDIEFYTDYIILNFSDNTRFTVLEVTNEQLGNINVQSKLKRAVRGYFAYDKSR